PPAAKDQKRQWVDDERVNRCQKKDAAKRQERCGDQSSPLALPDFLYRIPFPNKMGFTFNQRYPVVGPDPATHVYFGSIAAAGRLNGRVKPGHGEGSAGIG